MLGPGRARMVPDGFFCFQQHHLLTCLLALLSRSICCLKCCVVWDIHTLVAGILSGKYTPDNIPTGPRGTIYNREYLIKVT